MILSSVPLTVFGPDRIRLTLYARRMDVSWIVPKNGIIKIIDY